MKLRKFENFGQDEQEFDVHGLGAQEAQEAQEGHEDAQAFAVEETQEEETLELDEVVNKILAAVEEDKNEESVEDEEGVEKQDLRSKITAILADFHSSEENEEEHEDEFEGDSDEDGDFGFASHDGSFGGDDSEYEMPKFESLKKFSDFK
jgi:hypothetical protein